MRTIWIFSINTIANKCDYQKLNLHIYKINNYLNKIQTELQGGAVYLFVFTKLWIKLIWNRTLTITTFFPLACCKFGYDISTAKKT